MANRLKCINFPDFTDWAIREKNKMEGAQWLEIYSNDGDEVVRPGRGAATLPFFADFGGKFLPCVLVCSRSCSDLCPPQIAQST